VSENTITRQQAGLLRGAKNEPSETPMIPLRPALVGNPLCLGKEEHTMRATAKTQ
jgi:hypothetical protein